MNVAAIAPVRKLKRREYDRMVELGLFQNERVELIDGILVAKSPQGSRHVYTVARLNRFLTGALVNHALVLVQAPLALGETGEPEPDLAVVEDRNYTSGLPETAFLVVEVADSSLQTDRDIKSYIYASAGIPEYWLVDIPARTVEVRRAPQDGAYTSVTRVDESGTLRPLSFPDVAIAAAEILPTR